MNGISRETDEKTCCSQLDSVPDQPERAFIGELKLLKLTPDEPTEVQRELLQQLESLASLHDWHSCFMLAEESMNQGNVHQIWERLHEYRGIAAEQVGEWAKGAFSWLWIASESNISPDEGARRTQRGIICQLNNGAYDDAEKQLFDAQWDYPDFTFNEAIGEFKQRNYCLCFQKAESERLPSLLIVPPEREHELPAYHVRSHKLVGMNSACYADIIHRLRSSDFICLYELCRNPELEQLFAACMMPRCATAIIRDREYFRSKELQPIIPFTQATRVLRFVERLAKVSIRKNADTPDYGGDFYGTIFRL
jgi:hypothetical protein